MIYHLSQGLFRLCQPFGGAGLVGVLHRGGEEHVAEVPDGLCRV